MHPIGEDFGYGSWRADGHSLHIEYSVSVLESIVAAVMSAFGSGAGGPGAETAGVLFGKHSLDRIEILAWRPLVREEGESARLSLTERDEAHLGRLLRSVETDPKLKGLSPVGWVQSTLRRNIALTGDSLEIYRKYFSEPWQVALLIRPSFQRPTMAGFFFREATGELRTDSSYREFLVAPPNGKVSTPAPAPAQPEEPETVPFKSFEARRKPFRWVPWITGGLLVAAAAAVALFTFARPAQRPPWKPALRVVEVQDQLHIQWSPPIETPSAVLEIDDSGAKIEKRLEKADLASGSFTYQRHGTDVKVRMSFVGPGKSTEVESTWFVGPVRDTAELQKKIADLEESLSKAEDAAKRERNRANKAERALKKLVPRTNGGSR